MVSGYPLSVAMTPAYYDPQNMLLRMQLKCLALQTVKDFDVWLIDPHYQKRRGAVPELAERFSLDIKHVPYTPNLRVAKQFDCAIFNAAFCYSSAPRIVRYSCYRFVRPSFVETILAAPAGVNVDFFYHAVGPDLVESCSCIDHHAHERVWNFDGEDIHWEHVPERSGYDNGRITGLNTLASWTPESDQDEPEQPVPGNCYGNIAWYREQWLAVNGTNEVITNSVHYEDMDFTCRAAMAGQRVVRRAHQMYRLFHYYGEFAQRANVEVDAPYKPPCEACCHVLANAGDDDYSARLEQRLSDGAVWRYESQLAWVCKDCLLSGPLCNCLTHFPALRASGRCLAPVIADHRIGRNLLRVAEALDKETTLAGKEARFTDSWNNPIFYEAA